MSRRRLLLLAIVLIGFAGAGLGAWAAFLRPIAVQVVRAEDNVPVQVFGLGTVEARVASKVGFNVSGVVVDLRADIGDRIAKGAVLARLDDREQRARVARTVAVAEQSRANLQKALAGVAKAKANYANAKSVSARRQMLLGNSSTSVEQAEAATTAEATALADMDLAAAEGAVARAAISDAVAQGQQETATLDFHTLMSPYDAMVVARQKELGSALSAVEPVFTLIDPQTVWVLAYVDESKAGEIKAGQPAEILLRSRPYERFGGQVARIEPESDRVNEERRIAVAFDQIPANFNLGEQAEVYIITVHLMKPLLVPEAAITGLGKSRGTVWTVEDNRLQQHMVTLGHRLLDGRFEVTGGVPDGALVVTPLRSGLRLGRAAKVAAGQAP